MAKGLPLQPNRNGLPEFRPYVYRGTGEDIGPALPRKPYVRRRRPDRCGRCGYLLVAPGHRIMCGSD